MAARRSGGEVSKQAARRVPRNTLSRSMIVEAALELIDAAGLDAVTMPNVARRLGVGTMSLYRHVGDKGDLIDAVAERVMGQIGVPDGAADDWEGRVVGYLRALRETAAAHPALSARILADHGLTVGPVFVQLETVHGILVRAGFAPGDAVRAFYSLFTYVFGFVMWELPRVHQQPVTSTPPRGTAPSMLSTRASIRICTRCALTCSAASDDQFEYGLSLLVESLRSRAGEAASSPTCDKHTSPADVVQRVQPLVQLQIGGDQWKPITTVITVSSSGFVVAHQNDPHGSAAKRSVPQADSFGDLHGVGAPVPTDPGAAPSGPGSGVGCQVGRGAQPGTAGAGSA